MTSKEIYELIEFETGLDLKRKTRNREYVEARSVANKLCRKYTAESLQSIGNNGNLNYATVLHSISCFENVYQKYSITANDLFTRIDEFLSTDESRFEKVITHGVLLNQLINLRQENRRLRFRLQKVEAA